jgi:hypothetical protein
LKTINAEKPEKPVLSPNLFVGIGKPATNFVE